MPPMFILLRDGDPRWRIPLASLETLQLSLGSVRVSVKRPSLTLNASFGLSPAATDLRHILERVADRDVSVLLFGETGSGQIRIDRKLNSTDVIGTLSDLFVLRACS